MVIITVLSAPFDAVTVAVTTIGVLTLDVTEPDELPPPKLENSTNDCPDEDEESKDWSFGSCLKTITTALMVSLMMSRQTRLRSWKPH
jgi:hypothetical protein